MHAREHLIPVFPGRGLRWLALLAIAWALNGQAGVVLDQYNFAWHEHPLALGGDSEQMLAQTYESRRNGTLDHVQLVIGCSADSPGAVTVELRTVLADGSPSHVVLGATTRAAATFPSVVAIEDISLPAVPIVSGTEYALVMWASADASCATRRGAGPMFHSPGVRSAFFDARPNPPGWVPLTHLGTEAYLPFFVHVDTGRPASPRYCDFRTADGIPNDWLPNDVPLCGCARDPGLVSHRCWFATPDFMLWRTLVPVPNQPRMRAEWSLVPMTNRLPGITIKEYDPNGPFSSQAIRFKPGASPGRPSRQNVRYVGSAAQSEVMILVDGEPEPATIIFETLLEIPEQQD